MAKKILLATIITIMVIITCMFVAIGIVRAETISAVSGVSMKDSTCDTITVNWNVLKKADGYYLYNYDKAKDKYTELAKVEGKRVTSYQLKNLSGSTIYNLRIKGYRNLFGKEFIGANSNSVVVYTNPDKPIIYSFSGSKGVLSVEWNEQESISGFEIKLSKDKSFADANVIEIDDGEARNVSIENLDIGDKYFVQGRAFIKVKSKKIYSEWSDIDFTVIQEKNLFSSTINPNKPIVALSFDDGPAFDYEGQNSTERILDTLEKYGARATFFMVGERVDESTKHLLEREIQLGCELGNHTYAHTHYGSDVTVSDISKASSRIKKYSGKAPTIFRCPGGNLTKKIREECKEEKMPLAYWSVDTKDWKYKDAKKIYKEAINHVYDGSIILMHDIYPSTAEAVEKLVPELQKKGYQVVSVSEMIAAKTGDNPKAGQQYVDYKTINNNTK